MEKKNLSHYHLIRPPKISREKPPALFMLHGYGSHEEDLFSFAPDLPENLFIIALRAPYELMPYGYAWYHINFDAEAGKWSDNEQAKTSVKGIVSFIDEACKAYDLDSNHVTLLGFSQGTILSYAVALSHPEKVKNVVALSGYINPEILAADYKDKNHAGLHFYCSHGNQDPVIPVEWARRAPNILEDLQIDYIYEEFPAGHGVAPQNFYALLKWLKQKV